MTIQSDFFNVAPLLGQPTRAAWSDAVVTLLSPLDRTAAEISAGITPTNYEYPIGDVRRYGATGDGVTDDTAAINAALSANDDIFVPSGTYSVTGLTLSAGNKRIYGAGMGRTIIKLAAASNAHLLQAVSLSDVQIEDLTLDGNKANQSVGTGNNWRCLYVQDISHRWLVRNVHIKDAVDHGLFFSDGGTLANETGKDSVIENCRATGCGSSAHASGGGAGGTGFVGATESTKWISCTSRENYLNGFKSNGQHLQCFAAETVNGGGYESGFSTPETKKTEYVSCRASNCAGGGFRHQGQGDELLMLGCTADGNEESGVTILNSVNKAQILGCRFSNNGDGGTRTTTSGLDGISILQTSGGGPSQILIDGCQIFDDQGGSATQEYGIYIDDPSTDVVITPNNIIQGHLTGPLSLSSGATDDNIRIGSFTGSTANYRNITPVSLTGTLVETDLMSQTLVAAEQFSGKVIRGYVAGSVSGTAGTKIIRLKFGTSSLVIANQVAGDTQDWACRFEFVRVGTRAIMTVASHEEGGTSAVAIVTEAISLATDVTIKVTGTLGNTGDTITQEFMTLAAEM